MTNSELLALAKSGELLSGDERAKLTADHLMGLPNCVEVLSIDDRKRLKSDQLLSLARMGAILSPEERATLTPDHLLRLPFCTMMLTPDDRKRLTGDQLLLLDEMGAELKTENVSRLTNDQKRRLNERIEERANQRNASTISVVLNYYRNLVASLNTDRDFHKWNAPEVVRYVAAHVREFNQMDVENVLKDVGLSPSDGRGIIWFLLQCGELKEQSHDPTKLPTVLMERGSQEEYKRNLADFRRSREHGGEPEAHDVSRKLTELVPQVTEDTQRTFLAETMTNLSSRTYRSAIVMSWNLAYDHLLHWLSADPARLASFNAKLTARRVTRGVFFDPVSSYDDFMKIKEFVVIEESGKAGLIDDAKDHLNEGLKKRNRYAHPNQKKATAAIAAGHISDLLEHFVTNPKYGWP